MTDRADRRAVGDRGTRPIPDRLVFLPAGMDGPRPRSSEVDPIDAATVRLIEGMMGLMKRSGYPSLSAPLVGVSSRVIAVDLTGTGRSQVVLINPVLERMSAERQVDLEGCPALPGIIARVSRAVRVVVNALTPSGQRVRLHAGGLLARMIQHELDHLDGRTLLDRLRGPERARIEANLRIWSPGCAWVARGSRSAARAPVRSDRASNAGPRT